VAIGARLPDVEQSGEPCTSANSLAGLGCSRAVLDSIVSGQRSSILDDGLDRLIASESSLSALYHKRVVSSARAFLAADACWDGRD
ncbi:MAG TPA: hypothetical protein VN622_06925, partial [Clostridia bacterium]|nr:hypothetical protein [Clostridia bacterium]